MVESFLEPLTAARLLEGVAILTAQDSDLAAVVHRWGPPPLWAREPGFPTLVHIILEQQVSLASARAAFDRLLALATPLTPTRFLELDDVTLRAVGFSRQKTGYNRHLAQSIVTGEFDIDGLVTLSDEAARAALVARKGIGPWTADIYLLMCLGRPDVWPVGDLALQVAMQSVKGLTQRPTVVEMATMGEAWRPWRAVAARLLWHHYLRERGLT
ncbi:MAG: DNA-3-methyladenine glycosylase 2 family protein [Caldilinea sp. CFX5]|nr:DNA-3-methyladenine glycosylase 2 family protein [Caldilinea sp. CFX5]